MHWIADDDPLKIKAINDGPIIDFFILLDEKIKQSKQRLKRVKTNK